MSSQSLRRPSEILDQSPMRGRQWLVVLICILAMALDGYDVMSISLAGAGITQEWGLTKAELGFLLPLEFIGMAIGLIFIGTLTDLYGRRMVFLLCLIIITLGMAGSGYAYNMETLAASRVFTGLGIGGMMASATALSSEYSNAKNRSLTVIMVAGGYTFGIYLASQFSGMLLEGGDWRAIFTFGAWISFAFIPVVVFLVPESIGFLERRRPDGFVEKIGTTLEKIGFDESFDSSVPAAEDEEKISPMRLFEGETRRITIIMMICYLGNILTYYYFVKWMPAAVTDLGYTAVEGTRVLGMISIGGLTGSIAMAFASRLVNLKTLMIICLTGSALSVAAFPFFTSTLSMMLAAGTLAGFFLFAVIGGAFGLFAYAFPPAVLGSGVGVVLGTGRGGAVVGPWVGGLLFAGGMSLYVVSPIMAAGSFMGAIALLFLPKQNKVGG